MYKIYIYLKKIAINKKLIFIKQNRYNNFYKILKKL